MRSKKSPKFKLNKRRLFIPLGIFIVISFLSLKPVHVKIYQEKPLDGDDFKSPNSAKVFHFQNEQKYIYPNSECYFSFNKPPYGTTYGNGGIKVIQENIVDQIPLGGDMCDADTKKIIKPSSLRKEPNQLSFAILLYRFSEIGHFTGYFILAVAMLFLQYGIKFTSKLTFCGGVIIEFLQGLFVVGREAALDDLLLNSIGITVAIVFYKAYNLIKKPATIEE